jgi:hypothetical protein
MATIRIESVPDATTGQFLAEVYVEGRAEPILRSQPAFASHEDLADQVVAMCRAHFPDHFPFVDDPTIGV